MKTPALTDVVVQGPGNQPGDGTNPYDVSDKVYLDLCIVGSLAPGAKIAVYFTQFSEQGWVEAISRAATDAVHSPSVISISYGNPENDPRGAWTKMAIKQVNDAFEAAAAAGRTICCAAGDSGASDEPGTTKGQADFPASSPWVLACGGTRLESSGGHDLRRARVERSCRRERRHWRRRPGGLRAAELAGGHASGAGCGRDATTRWPWHSGCCVAGRSGDAVCRCRPGRVTARGRQHERRGATLVGVDQPVQPGARRPGGIPEPAALQRLLGRAPGHHERQQRWIRGRARVGRMHWMGLARRVVAAAGDSGADHDPDS